MKIGDVFEGHVRGVSSEGLGVVEAPDRRVFFVPATWTGDHAKFEITELRRRHGIARVRELIRPSPARLTAPCPYHGFAPRSCGGCPWQFVSYEAQLAAKQDRVEQSLRRARLEVPVLPIMPSPRAFGYRNRAQLKTDGEVLGFVEVASRRIAPVGDCLVLTDKNRGHLRELVGRLPNPDWKPSAPHPWNFIDIDEDFTLKGLQLNKRRPFRQANDEQNEVMRAWLKSRLSALPRDYSVLELFAGSGNFTEVIVDQGFSAVGAAEVVDEALEKLRAKNLPRVTCVAADLFDDDAYPRLRRALGPAQVLVLDPPRDGLKQKKGLFASYPELERVASISCDVATFTRDLGDFLKAGFRAVEIQPLDQFPHTPHIEIMAWLERD